MENNTFNRQQLYDLVWSEPLLTLSKKYNISDVGLRKACIRMGVPLPKIGYWNKVKVGKPVEVTRLPTDHKGDQQIHLSFRTDNATLLDVDLSPTVKLQKEIEQDIKLNLLVPIELINPDPLIVGSQRSFLKRSDRQNSGDYLFSESGQLEIRVFKSSLKRALCLMDTFIKAMRVRGHDFLINEKGTFLMIGEEEIQMSLRESQTTLIDKEKWEPVEFEARGAFSLYFKQIWGSVTSKDGSLPIEQQLSKIISRLEILGEKLKAESIKIKKWREEYDRNKRLEEEFSARKKNELHGFKQLLQDSRRWNEVQMLRKYINQVEQEAVSKDNLTEELKNWLNWAKKKADWYDPLLETQDEWLKGVNQNSLLLENSINVNSSQDYRYNYSSDRASSKPSWPLPWYKR